jgi:hypothetical protein
MKKRLKVDIETHARGGGVYIYVEPLRDSPNLVGQLYICLPFLIIIISLKRKYKNPYNNENFS